MAGPILALQFFLLIGWFGLILILLIYAVKRRNSLRKALLSGLLCLGLLFLSWYIYYSYQKDEYIASQKFLGKYKLLKLDRKDCENCNVILKDGYNYDILVDDKLVGKGEWHLGSAVDIPGLFLVIENGPGVAWEHERMIDFIDRTEEK